MIIARAHIDFKILYRRVIYSYAAKFSYTKIKASPYSQKAKR